MYSRTPEKLSLNQSMIDIRIADLHNDKDANDLLELLGQYAQHPMGGGHALPEFTQNNLVDTLLSRLDCVVILAYHNDRAVGLCNCFEGFSTFACKPLLNIHDVYVADSYRGQGIAGSMMQKAEQLATARGYCKLTLEVLTHNESAKKSYRSLGYQPYRLNEQFGQAEFWQKLIPENV